MLTLEQIDSIEKYQIPNLIAAKQSKAVETIKQLCETVRDCYGLLGWIPATCRMEYPTTKHIGGEHVSDKTF